MTYNRLVHLADGRLVPAIGLGTWHMGESQANRTAEVAALRCGIELGLSVIDTAEMYANGGAEKVTADAISGQRDKVYLVSKVLPSNASRAGTIAACEASLRRLKTDYLDLYLLHWRGGYKLAETVDAFEALKDAGKIREWGVSNFDTDDVRELQGVTHGTSCIANQVLYHAASRGIEFDLLPFCQAKKIAVMAYCPLGQGKLINDPVFERLARKHGAAASAIILAWLITKPGVLAIPKSGQAARVAEFANAFEISLDAEDLAHIDTSFSPPKRKMSLDMS